MINNANQNIRTNYQAQDVFVPNAANQLARAIIFDFVITPEILANYISKHPALTEIDIGDLIACDSEGNDGVWSTPVKAPVSIYIAGRTSLSDTYCFNFGGRLLTEILDCSDYQVGGSWDSTATADMVSVYSAHPYRLKELVAGINFWSLPDTIVSLVGSYATNAGVTKVGTYSTEGTSNLYSLGTSEFLQIVYINRIDGYNFTILPTAEQIEGGYRPAVVCADWMYGSNSATFGYYVDSGATAVPGLFQQVIASIGYRTEPIIFVRDTLSLKRYALSFHGYYELRFSNPDDGMSMVVSRTGDITWKPLASVGNGSAVITDMLTPDTLHKWVVGDITNLDSLLVVKPGFATFLTPQQDMARIDPTIAPDWYASYPGFSFDFGAITTLDWYFWYAISDYVYNDSTLEIVWLTNDRLVLTIDIGTLKEGVVYQINLHVVQLPTGKELDPETAYEIGTPPKVYGEQATPVTKYVNGSDLDSTALNLNPYIQFDSFTGGSTDVRLWGFPNRFGTNLWNRTGVYPAFYPAPEPNTGAWHNINAGKQLRDLARAKVLFTYLGGKVYIMSY